MKEIFYVELPTPDTDAVRAWLQQDWTPELGEKIITPDGIRLQFNNAGVSNQNPTSVVAAIPEISVFVWSVQRTTYLKAFRWAHRAINGERQILQHLKNGLRSRFLYHYPEQPVVDLSKQSIFEALAPYYPQTVHFFQKMPNGEYDLNRFYWWEKRWREGVRNPKQPKQVVFKQLQVSKLNVESSEHNLQPSSTTRMGTDARINTDNSSVYPSSNPSGANLQPSTPKDVVIEQNWLGIPPDERMPSRTSAFGVSVFNSLGTTIRRNRIANHEGSGIITSVQAKNLLVTENIIVGNGIAGMPDAIRLEGVIDNSQINGNLICGNDGSGVYLFKPEGAVQIRDNQITFNGRRLRRAAVYLMGDGNQVINNQIAYQSGPGVVVTSYPKNDVQR